MCFALHEALLLRKNGFITHAHIHSILIIILIITRKFIPLLLTLNIGSFIYLLSSTNLVAQKQRKKKKKIWKNILCNQKYWTPNERMTLGKMAKTTRILLRLELGAIRLVGSWCGPSPLAHYDVSLCGGCGFALLVASQPSGILVDSCHLFLHVWLNHSCELWYSFFNYLFPLFPFMGWINVAGFCMSGNFWKYHIAGFIPFSESIYWGII